MSSDSGDNQTLNNSQMNLCHQLIFQSAALLFATLAYAQQTTVNRNFQQKADTFLNENIERLPWNVNLNIVPVLYRRMSGWITYPYVIKRNVGKGHRLGAWRFSLFPSLINRVEILHLDTTFKFLNKHSNFFRPRLELGYEWHRVKGRFTLFYGVNLIYALEYEREKSGDHFYPLGVPAPPRGKYKYRAIRNYISIASLIGAKCHLSKHFSISLETQLQARYFWENSSTNFNGALLQKDYVDDWAILSYPIYALNLACHF